eukprot:649362-Rhodomonas_salina.1
MIKEPGLRTDHSSIHEDLIRHLQKVRRGVFIHMLSDSICRLGRRDSQSRIMHDQPPFGNGFPGSSPPVSP